jgi:hypothetical protein
MIYYVPEKSLFKNSLRDGSDIILGLKIIVRDLFRNFDGFYLFFCLSRIHAR